MWHRNFCHHPKENITIFHKLHFFSEKVLYETLYLSKKSEIQQRLFNAPNPYYGWPRGNWLFQVNLEIPTKMAVCKQFANPCVKYQGISFTINYLTLEWSSKITKLSIPTKTSDDQVHVTILSSANKILKKWHRQVRVPRWHMHAVIDSHRFYSSKHTHKAQDKPLKSPDNKLTGI